MGRFVVFIFQSGKEVFMTDCVINLGEWESSAVVKDVGCLSPDRMTMHEGL